MKYKSKIIILVSSFIALSAIMFLFVFGKLQARNLRLSTEVATERRALEQLQQEQRSFEQGKKDLENLQSRTVQPDDLFSRDTRVVKEIKTLEDLSTVHSLEMNLQVAGTAKNAQKVKSSNQVLFIPYTITVTGSFDKVLAFLDSMENLSFISPVKNIAMIAEKTGVVKATISADFYIKK